MKKQDRVKKKNTSQGISQQVLKIRDACNEGPFVQLLTTSLTRKAFDEIEVLKHLSAVVRSYKLDFLKKVTPFLEHCHAVELMEAIAIALSIDKEGAIEFVQKPFLPLVGFARDVTTPRACLVAISLALYRSRAVILKNMVGKKPIYFDGAEIIEVLVIAENVVHQAGYLTELIEREDTTLKRIEWKFRAGLGKKIMQKIGC